MKSLLAMSLVLITPGSPVDVRQAPVYTQTGENAFKRTGTYLYKFQDAEVVLCIDRGKVRITCIVRDENVMVLAETMATELGT
jgi:hypothetical protein